jgi:hypothetical protein
MNNAAKSFGNQLSALHNYFDGLKLLSDLYPAKGLDTFKHSSFRA